VRVLFGPPGSVGVRGSNPLSSTVDQVCLLRRFPQVGEVVGRAEVIFGDRLVHGRVTLLERIGRRLLPMNGPLGCACPGDGQVFVILPHLSAAWGSPLSVLADRDGVIALGSAAWVRSGAVAEYRLNVAVTASGVDSLSDSGGFVRR
jgi:hypothetical protein